MELEKLNSTIDQIMRGIEFNDSIITGNKLKPRRMSKEIFLEVLIKNKNANLKADKQKMDPGQHLMFINTFLGIKPFYKPWIEFFSLNYDIQLNKNSLYIDSKIENNLLKAFTEVLGPGEKVFVSYEGDKETTYGLTYGFPVQLTRLGNKLFKLGFSWFKDWYFPEGGSEGAQRLQGEKPLNEIIIHRHLKETLKEIYNFTAMANRESTKMNKKQKTYIKNALKRSDNVLAMTSEN